MSTPNFQSGLRAPRLDALRRGFAGAARCHSGDLRSLAEGAFHRGAAAGEPAIGSCAGFSPGVDALSAGGGAESKAEPARTVSQRIADTTITIEYNRPVARGRELFGKFVPYGRVWCPCADDARRSRCRRK